MMMSGIEADFLIVFEPSGSTTEVKFSTEVRKEGMMKMTMGIGSSMKNMAKHHIKKCVKETLKLVK